MRALRATAQRIQALQAEADELQAELTVLVGAVAPWLLEVPGVGPLSAAQVLVSWSHAGRFRSEAAFAALAGTNPIPASSGQVTRHRLNRGGDRQLNRALHTIVLVRLRDRSRHPRLHGPPHRRGQEPPRRQALPASASSPGSCSDCWNATTNPASRSSGRLDST